MSARSTGQQCIVYVIISLSFAVEALQGHVTIRWIVS